jgi:hypothetical protein
MPHDAVQPESIRVWPLGRRKNLLRIAEIAINPDAPPPPVCPAPAGKLDELAQAIRRARDRGRSVMLAYGAHLIKNGGGPLLRRLLEGGWVTHLATQGAGIIHDWELAFQGATSESVRENVAAGTFGQWDQTGRWINLAVLVGATQGLGFGEAMGRLIATEQLALPEPQTLERQITAQPGGPKTAARADLLWAMRRFDLMPGLHRVEHPHASFSATAGAYQAGIPLTVHPGIGYDIFTNHPLFHGGAIGRAAGIDARIFAAGVRNLDAGVYLSVGSAIMSPQVFEKALSLANDYHIAHGREAIGNHTIGIVDIQPGEDWDWDAGEPPKDHPAYYLRFCKSFHRMGGRVRYCRCDNTAALAHLLQRLR